MGCNAQAVHRAIKEVIDGEDALARVKSELHRLATVVTMRRRA